MPMGRTPKLNENIVNKMAELVKHGNYIEVAAAACGVTEASFYNWMRRGREVIARWPDISMDDLEDAVYEGSLTQYEADCVKLFEAMKVANAEAEATAVLHVRKQMPDQWQAAMTFLERRYPGRWKRRDETTVRPVFDPVADTSEGGLDERALLQDPEAVRLMHDALVAASRGELPAATADVDSTAVPMDIAIREDEVS